MNAQGAQYAPPVIIARTGWTTAGLQQGIRDAGIAGRKYDRVSLLIGVNNEFQGRSLREYEKELTALLEQAIGFAKDKQSVCVISIPDYGFTPFGKREQVQISLRIDQFNAVAQKVCEAQNVRFINITPVSRKGLEDPTLVAEDGLHPSGKMYAEFVKCIQEGFPH